AIHRVLRAVGITKEESFPSEWCSAFSGYEFYLVLHLKGGQRLFGWPVQWPNQHDCGHFIISQPAWFLPNAQMIPLSQLHQMLIPATEVLLVEQYKKPDQLKMTEDEIRKSQQPLIELHKENIHVRRKLTDTGNSSKRRKVHRTGANQQGSTSRVHDGTDG